MSWDRALSECAYVMAEAHACREAGFTTEALHYPRSEAGMIALCAFNGIKPEQAPRGWRYWPNPAMKKSWERVIDALAKADRSAKRQDPQGLGPKGESGGARQGICPNDTGV